ncbi:hypothetical protein HID58_059964, partial [Brassica napus]
ETMAGDMEAIVSEIIKRMEKTKHANDFFGNVSQSHKLRRPTPRSLERANEPLYSKKESAIQELKTEPSK